MHCHLRHHPMNAMGHDIPNVLGVSQAGLEGKVQELLPGYMAMGPLPTQAMPIEKVNPAFATTPR